jgi:tetratricopeptide (TPR) repeat protein
MELGGSSNLNIAAQESRDAIDIKIARLPSRSSSLARSMADLSVIYRKTQQLELAESWIQKAVSSTDKPIEPADMNDHAGYLSDLADTLALQLKYDPAIKAYSQADTLFSKDDSASARLQRARTQFKLGQAYLKINENRLAHQIFQQSLKLAQQSHASVDEIHKTNLLITEAEQRLAGPKSDWHYKTADLPVRNDQRYTQLTRQILLTGIELERFSLNYLLETGHQSRLKKIRYFLTQETGASGGLAFEIGTLRQFDVRRNQPGKINDSSLHAELTTDAITSIIAGSGSCLELICNGARALKNRQHGFDARTANRFVAAKMGDLDRLLAQRNQLVAELSDQPAHSRAVAEGEVLKLMRTAFANEYAHFTAETRSALACQNLFYSLNAAYNVVSATAAFVGYQAGNRPRLNGSSNILFTVSGAMAGVSPLLCSAGLWLDRKIISASVAKRMDEAPGSFNIAEFSASRKKLEELISNSEGSLIASLSTTNRVALYTESDALFAKQLDSQTTKMRKLDKVALQTNILGPAIGSLLMTQGILNTRGSYNYPNRTRKQLDLNFRGSVLGTAGTGLSVVGNAAWLLASLSYEHHLKESARLPEQLIRERLAHIDELEKVVQAM